MTIEISRLASDLIPENTVLFIGAGACIQSHAPSVQKLIEIFESTFGIECNGYNLREFTGIIEEKFGRKQLIQCLRKPFEKLQPTGSLLNIPLYNWKSIFTTNYDKLIEESYKRKHVELVSFESNFDFTANHNALAAKLFKIHGTIEKDISDGYSSRIVITDNDYDNTQPYREGIYDRLKSDLHGSTLLVIGHSLADEDIKSIANRAAEITNKNGGTTKIVLLMYTHDIDRAKLLERRGIQVCFGSLDDFFSAIANKLPFSTPAFTDTNHPLDNSHKLRPVTIEVSHAAAGTSDGINMFNGWPATYADIQSGLTFKRNIDSEILNFFENEDNICASILGASGLGKTTAARQILLEMQGSGYICWEHKNDFQLTPSDWVSVARSLNKYGTKAILLIDDAHTQLHEVNILLDTLHSEHIKDLKLLLTSTRNHWNPRIKSLAFFKIGKEFGMGKLKAEEVDKLINLIETNNTLRKLTGDSFSGFTRYEKRRRLIERCESETFVCLKNIFSSEKFDDIILREYAALDSTHQEIYRFVAAMESSGVRVHRQLVIRLLGIPAQTISAALNYLTDIINEYPINEKEGIYGWKGRHSVIVGILTKYKFHEMSQIVDLFDKVIDSISPTFEIEIRSIRELCNIESGLPRIPDKEIQNRLLRKMISIAPGERVPRHRLIRNLIETGDFEKADAEIRIFEKDFGKDAPVTRYKIKILIGRAIDTAGIMTEDRVAILNQAKDATISALARYSDHKGILAIYCEIGIEIYKLTGKYDTYDEAMLTIKNAEATIGDPEISKLIQSLERKMAGQSDHNTFALTDD